MSKKTYWAKLRLVLEVPNNDHVPDARTAFGNHWTGSAEHAWSNLYFDAEDDWDLADQLDTYFEDNIRKLSTAPGVNWVFDDVISAAGWRVGGGGLHSSYAKVTFTNSGAPGTWTVPYTFGGNNFNGTVHVEAEWLPL